MENNNSNKNTYVISDRADLLNYTKYFDNEEYMDMIFDYSKKHIENIINKLKLSPLREEVLNSYISLDYYKDYKDHDSVNESNNVRACCFAYKHFKDMTNIHKFDEIIKKTEEFFQHKFRYKIALFLDVTNTNTNVNKIFPLLQQDLYSLINMLFTDRLINEEDVILEKEKTDLFYINSNDNSVRFNYRRIGEPLLNLLNTLNINSQDEIKYITINGIVDIGFIDINIFDDDTEKQTISYKNIKLKNLNTKYEESKEFSIQKYSKKCFEKSLNLYKNIGISTKELTDFSNDLLFILKNEYESYKTIRRINMLDYGNNLSYSDAFPPLASALKFYCKKCKKNSVIPNLLAVKSEAVNKIECPMCGELHEINNKDILDIITISNISIYDDRNISYDDKSISNKIKFKIFSSGYISNKEGIYYKSNTFGFTYNLKTNRAYIINKVANKKNRVKDISGLNINLVQIQEFINMKYKNCQSIDESDEIKNNKFKECFNELYDLISDNIDIKYTKKEILEISSNALANYSCFYERNIKNIRFTDSSVENINIVNATYIYLYAMKIIGEIIKYPTACKEYLEAIGTCTNPIVNYINRSSKKNGRYLTNKFGMSNCIRKEIIKKPWKIMNYTLFKDVIKDPNNMMKILNINVTNEDMNNLVSNIIPENRDDNIWQKSIKSLDIISTKFKELIEPFRFLYKNENTFVNRFILNDIKYIDRYLYDTCRIIDRLQSNNINFTFSSKFDLKRLHDEVSSAERKLNKRNEFIKIDKDEEKLEFENDIYKLSLAKDTHKLIDLGCRLNICVGSYDDRALNKYCTILYVVNKLNNEDVCCIEVRKDISSYIKNNNIIYNLYQTKTYSNDKPNGELRLFLLDWIKENKINIQRTNDISFEESQISKLGQAIDF